MKVPLIVLSVASLIWTVTAPVLYFTDAADLPQTKWQLLLATILWFAVTPFWMEHGGRAKKAD